MAENVAVKKVIKLSIINGMRKARKTSIDILKIMLPVSLLMTVANRAGLFFSLSGLLEPISDFLGIQPQTLIAFITGIWVNCYSAIAIIITTPMFKKELIIVSLMILFSHTLPIELSIQKKAGANSGLIFVIRISASLLTAFCLNLFLSEDNILLFAKTNDADTTNLNWLMVFINWIKTNFFFIIKLIVLMNLFMIIHEFLEQKK